MGWWVRLTAHCNCSPLVSFVGCAVSRATHEQHLSLVQRCHTRYAILDYERLIGSLFVDAGFQSRDELVTASHA